jgi:hypothetical protein
MGEFEALGFGDVQDKKLFLPLPQRADVTYAGLPHGLTLSWN